MTLYGSGIVASLTWLNLIIIMLALRCFPLPLGGTVCKVKYLN